MAMVWPLHRLNEIGIQRSTQGSKHRKRPSAGGCCMEAEIMDTCMVSALTGKQPDTGLH